MKTTAPLLLCALGAFSLASTCAPSEGCAEGATRCRGAAAEICDAGGRWAAFLDCGELVAEDGGPFACCVADPAASPDVTCLPVDACEASHGC